LIVKCPNCSTKFIVNDDLIPANGKKVKCSKCKQIWKQEKKSELISKYNMCVFWVISLTVTFILVYIGLIILFGNKIPIPNQLILFLEELGIPINGGNLFGRSFTR